MRAKNSGSLADVAAKSTHISLFATTTIKRVWDMIMPIVTRPTSSRRCGVDVLYRLRMESRARNIDSGWHCESETRDETKLRHGQERQSYTLQHDDEDEHPFRVV